MNREVGIINETLDILQKGSYNVGTETVKLKLSTDRQTNAIYFDAGNVAELREHPHDNGHFVLGRCGYGVLNMDSFEAARNMAADYRYRTNKGAKNVLVLNFANPVSPGGGVRRGANAQEEDLCRKSSLLHSLESKSARPYYEAHRKLDHELATDAMLLSPEVEIFRGNGNLLLPETTVVAVLTCAAPAIRFETQPVAKKELEELLYNRIMGMLHVAAHEGYSYLVLGAWGCGAFGNDPDMVSDMFYKALKDFRCGRLREKDKFRQIVFAVLDRTNKQRNLKAFERNFEYFYRDEDDAEVQRVMERIKETEVHLDSIRGGLFGGAVGDALGYPVEFMSWGEIQKRYGKGGIREYKLDKNKNLALISDDTQMTMFTACGILYGQTRGALRGIAGSISDYVSMAYSDWLATQDENATSNFPVSWILTRKELYDLRAPGNTCLSALSSGLQGTTSLRINNSKGCGGVMRIAPLGLTCPEWHGQQLEMLDKEGAEIAAITHGHPLGFIPAAFLTHVIHEAAFSKDKGSGLRRIVLEALDMTERIYERERDYDVFDALVRDAIEYAGNDKSDVENIHTLGGGWVAEEAVAIAIYCSVRYENAFSKGIIAAVNHSGDSDSTGAITGNILGAWLGYRNIKDKWKHSLELSDVILELADDLCHGCQMSEYSSYKDENWLRKYVYTNNFQQ